MSKQDKFCKCGHLVSEHNSLGCMHTDPVENDEPANYFKYCECRIKKDALVGVSE